MLIAVPMPVSVRYACIITPTHALMNKLYDPLANLVNHCVFPDNGSE